MTIGPCSAERVADLAALAAFKMKAAKTNGKYLILLYIVMYFKTLFRALYHRRPPRPPTLPPPSMHHRCWRPSRGGAR